MSNAKAYPVRFTPKGLSDAYDATDTFPGACKILQNLVFDQSNPETIVVRPGVGAALTSFAGFTTPGFISIHVSVGTRTFGMIATGRYAGHDEPFCYDNVAGAFVTISGVASTNTPLSPATSGTWVPPTMAIIGAYLILTHPGFSGTSAVFGAINLTNLAAPVWSATNLTTRPLPGVPTSVANFNNRAYYSYNNMAYYSDVLSPLVATNAGQSLTFGDNTPITVLSGLPIQTSSGGIVSGLVAFKPASIWQVTGDAAVAASVSVSYITLTTGTIAPRSVVPTSFGLAFVSIAGPYFLSGLGTVYPINNELSTNTASDVQIPFQNCTSPTRMAAGFQGNVYRVSVPTTSPNGNVVNDYWFDLHRLRWNGPHTFSYDCVSMVSGAASGTYFLLSSAANPGALYQSLSQPQPGITPVYNDLGVALPITMQSSSFPKTGKMTMKQIIECTMELSAVGAANTYNVTALNPRGNTVGSAALTTANIGNTWGSNIWGSNLWTPAVSVPYVYLIPWSGPVVFEKLIINIQTTAINALSIGTIYARYQDCGYTLMGTN